MNVCGRDWEGLFGVTFTGLACLESNSKVMFLPGISRKPNAEPIIFLVYLFDNWLHIVNMCLHN